MYQERVEKVLSAMEKMGLDQMLVSNPNSIWYLTGYYVFPYERMLALYLRRDGNHILFLNRLFPEPEADCRQIWFSDTDDCVAMVAEQVDGSKPLGIDKEWPACRTAGACWLLTAWTTCRPARTAWNRI